MAAFKERATFHTGKKHKKSGKAYKPDHNTNEYGRAQQEHIDPSMFQYNVYYYLDTKTKELVKLQGGTGGLSVEKIEREYAREQFKPGLDCINQRYKDDGHKEDMKTLNQHIKSKPPMEIMTELGGVESEIPLDIRGEILQEATMNTWLSAQKAFKDNMQLLDMGFHADEGWIMNDLGKREHLSNHMHTRVWFFIDGKDTLRDENGNPILNADGTEKKCKVINQTEALRQMGFGIPKYKKGMTKEEMEAAVKNPDNWGKYAKRTELYRLCQEQPEYLKHTKICSPLVAFTDYTREVFYRNLEKAAKDRGIDLEIEREVQNTSYRQKVKNGDIDISKDCLPAEHKLEFAGLTAEEFKTRKEEQRAAAAIKKQQEAQELAAAEQSKADQAIQKQQEAHKETEAERVKAVSYRNTARKEEKNVKILQHQVSSLKEQRKILEKISPAMEILDKYCDLAFTEPSVKPIEKTEGKKSMFGKETPTTYTYDEAGHEQIQKLSVGKGIFYEGKNLKHDIEKAQKIIIEAINSTDIPTREALTETLECEREAWDLERETFFNVMHNEGMNDIEIHQKLEEQKELTIWDRLFPIDEDGNRSAIGLRLFSAYFKGTLTKSKAEREITKEYGHVHWKMQNLLNQLSNFLEEKPPVPTNDNGEMKLERETEHTNDQQSRDEYER